MHFSQLSADNVFSGRCNIFQGDVEVRRCYFTSDPRSKDNVRCLDPATSAALVRSIQPYSYTIDGASASGMLADDVPVEYTHTAPNGLRSVVRGRVPRGRSLAPTTTPSSAICGRWCRTCRAGGTG